LGAVGDEVTLLVHTHVREDALVLYGFASPSERRAFEALLSAHGVGPTLALAVLSTLGADELAEAVEAEDLDAIERVPGVGRKTAQRLVLDLKGRLDHGVAPTVAAPRGEEPAARHEARGALASLGFSSAEVAAALEAVSSDAAVEVQVRLALRELASR
jgi:Holliday junction DNA helicase RuvA